MAMPYEKPLKKKLKNLAETDEGNRVNAGCFSSWLRRIRYALLTDTEMHVPCGDCRGCCISSYFIHIRPEEKNTLARISKQLLFPAPGLPKGNMLLGYFSDGACPMLTEKGCMVYPDRPKTCRAYDCRIFSAAGIKAGGKEKKTVNRQLEKWEFSYPTKKDRLQHDAVKTAAAFMHHKKNVFPDGCVPDNPSLLAAVALRVYPVFLRRPIGNLKKISPDTVKVYVQEVIEENRRFAAACR